MNKNRQIISELKDFFKHNDSSKAVNAVSNVMDKLVIQAKTVGPVKNPNCKFTFVQLVKLLVLFPFFSVKTAADYADSALGKLFSCKKDSFYCLMDDGRIDWRRIIYSINRQLIGLISRRADAKGNTRCVILDDTDLPKRGMKAEGLGKVFSHTAMKRILGFKAMFLCYTDGKTQLMVDATIQAESGKDANKPQGLTKKQKSAQYSKERNEDEKVNTRKAEMHQTKIANAIKKLRRAIMEGLRFDYLLVDSWFPCAELLRFIHSRHIKCHIYKKGNGSWNALITTDMGIDAKRTFELYARRWCIEVAHKEMKGLLNLGKCQCVDFAGQIAALSLCMIQYNILGTVKRFESYETIGGLFTELTGETVELTVIQRIWGLIIKVINVIAEFISCDPFELTENVINNNHQIKAVKMAFDRLDLAAAAA